MPRRVSEHDEPGFEGRRRDITELRKRAVNHEKPEYEEAMKVTEEDMTLDFILEERARELFRRVAAAARPETLRQAPSTR